MCAASSTAAARLARRFRATALPRLRRVGAQLRATGERDGERRVGGVDERRDGRKLAAGLDRRVRVRVSAARARRAAKVEHAACRARRDAREKSSDESRSPRRAARGDGKRGRWARTPRGRTVASEGLPRDGGVVGFVGGRGSTRDSSDKKSGVASRPMIRDVRPRIDKSTRFAPASRHSRAEIAPSGRAANSIRHRTAPPQTS